MNNINNNEQLKRASHGGARPGAGRKRLPGQVFNVRILDKQFLEHLGRVPDASLEVATFATKCFHDGNAPFTKL